MELRVITKTDTELSLEIGGEDHTFLIVLKRALLDTEGVDGATYDMNPEQSGGQVDPILTIETSEGVDPLDALAAASQSIQETATAFSDAFRDAADAAA